MVVTTKVDGLAPSRLIEPKHVPASPRSTRVPVSSKMSTAPDRTT